MSFTPKTWNTGDTVYSTDMNRIEQGIADGGGGGGVIITDNGTALDKTYAEIYDLINSGTPCYISWTGNGSTSDLDSDYVYYVNLMPIVRVFKYDAVYRIYALTSIHTDSSTSSYVGIPSCFVYQSNNSSSYPTFYRHSYVEGTIYASESR